MTFYTMALGLLELTSPYVFQEQHKADLQESLACFMAMMKAYFNRREAFSGFVEKIVSFLHLYLEHNAQDGSQFVRQHREVLAKYHQVFPQSQALKQLAQVLQLSVKEGEASETASTSTYCRSEKANAEIQARQLLATLDAAVIVNDENELAEILNQVKLTSQALPQILKFFAEDVGNLLSHETKTVRNIAYDIFVRVLKAEPTSSRDLADAYIGCLESHDPAVINHALDKLADVAPLMQGELSTIMRKAFSLGLYSRMNVSHSISETLILLNNLSGY